MTFTYEEKLDEVRREIKYRERVYARLVDAGKMSPESKARKIAIMEAIAADLESGAREERLL